MTHDQAVDNGSHAITSVTDRANRPRSTRRGAPCSGLRARLGAQLHGGDPAILSREPTTPRSAGRVHIPARRLAHEDTRATGANRGGSDGWPAPRTAAGPPQPYRHGKWNCRAPPRRRDPRRGYWGCRCSTGSVGALVTRAPADVAARRRRWSRAAAAAAAARAAAAIRAHRRSGKLPQPKFLCEDGGNRL